MTTPAVYDDHSTPPDPVVDIQSELAGATDADLARQCLILRDLVAARAELRRRGGAA